MTKKKKLVWIAIIICLLIGTIAAFYTFRAPESSVKRQKTEVEITAIELFANFENDENTSNQLYVGKTIEVSGIVTDISKNKDGSASIKLDANAMFGNVICNFSAEEIKKGNSATVGGEITIKGSCSGFLMDVILEKCTIVE